MKLNTIDWLVTETFMNGYNWIRIWNKNKWDTNWNHFAGFVYDLDRLKYYEDKFKFKRPIVQSEEIELKTNYPSKKIIYG